MPLKDCASACLITIQESLADFCRGGEVPSDEWSQIDSRIRVYPNLVGRVFMDTLSRMFPITRALMPRESWDSLVTSFRRDWPCSSPSLWKMPGEFRNFVQCHAEISKQFKWINDTLTFEWLETVVFMMKDLPLSPLSFSHPDNGTNLLFNPSLELFSLSYPVHRLADAPRGGAKRWLHTYRGHFELCYVRKVQTHQVSCIELSGEMAGFLRQAKIDPLGCDISEWVPYNELSRGIDEFLRCEIFLDEPRMLQELCS